MTEAIHIADQDRLTGIRTLLSTIMEKAGIDAVLVPARLAVKNRIMPLLVSDPERLAEADPFAPAFPLNAAQQLAKLTRMPAGGRLTAFLRPCEIRAFNELVKLNQGRRDDVVVIGTDCPGALSNSDFRTFADGFETADDATRAFCEAVASGNGVPEIASACRACTHFLPDGADIAIEWLGTVPKDGLIARARTREGEALLTNLDLSPAEAGSTKRKTAVDELAKQRKQYREELFAHVAERTGSLQALAGYLADCVNCYNCRVACPVCYCTTCVFTTDTFRHDPFQYMQWARRKGGVKMPTDTLFFHLTRMAHMSCACVGCGQCTNACPNDIPVSDLFTYVAKQAQSAFGYNAGMDLLQAPPMSGFEENEYEEVVGL
jgi:formate dehydrogenase subunit beta